MANVTSRILDIFLCEYCEVKGIKEDELKEHLALVHNPIKGALVVKEGEKELFRTVLSGMKQAEGECSLNYDIYLMDKVMFPKTSSLIKETLKE